MAPDPVVARSAQETDPAKVGANAEHLTLIDLKKRVRNSLRFSLSVTPTRAFALGRPGSMLARRLPLTAVTPMHAKLEPARLQGPFRTTFNSSKPIIYGRQSARR
jgi:hypothetical protein